MSCESQLILNNIIELIENKITADIPNFLFLIISSSLVIGILSLIIFSVYNKAPIINDKLLYFIRKMIPIEINNVAIKHLS